MRYFLLSVSSFFYLLCAGQKPDTAGKQLQEVVVKAFNQNRRLQDVPAAVNLVSSQQLERFSSNAIVSAVNTTPGVRMEERSPGSYRLSIRGSSLRSPFGVRNVKVYYNDIPFTDPGGNTYLNALGYYNFHSIEIIKGPGSSLYGAGTGGVMLIEGLGQAQQNGIRAEYTTGSYDLHNAAFSLTTGDEHVKNNFSFQHQQSSGYRQHSDLRRDIFGWNGLWKWNENGELKTTFLYSDLYYQTPGALTLTEYRNNPKAFRPAAGGFPSAEGSSAAIYQKSFLAGVSLTQQISTGFQNTTTVYGAFTQLLNPAIRNYGRNSEPHVGARTVFNYTTDIGGGKLMAQAGAELQQSFNTVAVHKNRNGNADSLQSLDDIQNRQLFEFVQLSFDSHNWNLTAGASYNQTKVVFQRFEPVLTGKLKRTYQNEFTPRISLLKKLRTTTLYSSISKGFSPPTTSELLPSGSAVNLELSAEEGTNYDAGVRTTLFKNLYLDLNAFTFSLHNTIVQRRDAGGGDYYINSGSTRQRGIELYASYPLFKKTLLIQRSSIWTSYTLQHFHYRSFKQLDNDFSGNRLPGTPPNTIAAGFNIDLVNGFFGNLTYYYSDHIALNDANTDYANPYHLLGIKLGYDRNGTHKLGYKIFAGVDNLLDEKYSLGNDINAFGGRYYNAAPERNFYVGVSLNVSFKTASM